MSYWTVAKTLGRTEEVKGSSFIAFVTPAETTTEVETHLQTIRAKHEDASHHCYAYKLGNVVKFSDDGEPSGTAGRPMLEVLSKRNLDHVLAVVTRYFGGTKLGAGGLVRAYSGSLAKVLDEAGVVEIKERVSLVLVAPFAIGDTVLRWVSSFPGFIKERLEYDAHGLVLSASLFAEDELAFKKTLLDVTRGQIKFN
jgi:uncharacterized YigZ family protein